MNALEPASATGGVGSGGRLSVLLASAAAGGTLAAVRCLGSRGADVRVLSSERLSAAAWSRWATQSYLAPREIQNRRFLDRLLEVGELHPGQILLPTSDETAWLYTLNSAVLKKYFLVNQPSIEAIRIVLDKKLLARAVSGVGLSTLPIWDPENVIELNALARELPFPILIKPRTHVHRIRNHKGIVVSSGDELIQQYQHFLAREGEPVRDELLPEAGRPILQQFVRPGNEGVQSITGFIDGTGDNFVTRRSTKLFQRSQPVGVGVCHESLPAEPELAQAAYRLCRSLGYFGIFEVEFLRFEGGWSIIDFNPRFFNQMGMDIHRGMPLPLFACLEALGDREGLREEVEKARRQDDSRKTVFHDGFTLRAILLAQTITAQTSAKDRARWRAWMKQNAGRAADVAAFNGDPLPQIIHALSEIYLGVKAFPRFLRKESPAPHAQAFI